MQQSERNRPGTQARGAGAASCEMKAVERPIVPSSLLVLAGIPVRQAAAPGMCRG